jgi:hypothetical protein
MHVTIAANFGCERQHNPGDMTRSYNRDHGARLHAIGRTLRAGKATAMAKFDLAWPDKLIRVPAVFKAWTWPLSSKHYNDVHDVHDPQPSTYYGSAP